MTQQRQETEKKSAFDLVPVAAGAVGAMASAVLLSTLGAAGTIMGAALGSVIVTVAGSVFSKGVDVSKQGVSAAQALAARRVAQAQSQVGAAAQDMDSSTMAQQRLSEANAELDAAESELHSQDEPDPATGAGTGTGTGTSWQDRLSVLPWKRIALGAAAVFLVAMAAITAFELVSGRAVSSMTGGSSDQERTSFSGLTGNGKSTPTPTPTPTESSSPSESASVEETPSGEPTGSASESPSPSEPSSSAPTTEPEVSDTAAPEESASPTP